MCEISLTQRCVAENMREIFATPWIALLFKLADIHDCPCKQCWHITFEWHYGLLQHHHWGSNLSGKLGLLHRVEDWVVLSK